ncbi:N-acetyl-gamma-glutamyl-phosphate reductase [Paraferrimonas haliotis]|uniref:N-acetyl-gamma-glutamyl-phosphate reductase n=1 Tax=Paraferrimonas haliotis TaxID=2013866 RepID=A0AA37WYW1_9GAMM|nr:N-acetyl-gamma-glutamyl-phosphate reductase [Paraferrimonas haliotis]GLS83541.1 N-acetyl-gamma-glutamyl-phosphate reductase [Paraferrimonas haliotis]
MKNIAIVGASGYTGAQLAQLIHNHSLLALQGLYVSAASLDAHKPLNQLYPAYSDIELPLQPLEQTAMDAIIAQADAVALCTAHEVSVTLAAQFIEAGLSVFDLSGAYRLDSNEYPQWYGFEHQQTQLLNAACYGLADFSENDIVDATLIAVPGCYPTASLTALKPIQHLIDEQLPVINAVSGVSGAGRKASLTSSYCEVSLNAYGVLNHRHQPEIAKYLGQDVVFTPHLGNFKRGILATISVKLKANVSVYQIEQAYQCFSDNPLVTVAQGVMPKLDDVVNTPRCHLGWQYDQPRQQLIVSSAIDNLMKGAASQALQCINIHYQLGKNAGLVKGA